MLFIGKHMLHFNTTETLADINREIEAVSTSQLMEVANELFDPAGMSLLAYKPS